MQQISQTIHENRADKAIKKIHERSANIDREHENQVHHKKENGNAQIAAQNKSIDFIGSCLADLRLTMHHVFGQAVNEAVTSVGNDQNKVGNDNGKDRYIISDSKNIL